MDLQGAWIYHCIPNNLSDLQDMVIARLAIGSNQQAWMSIWKAGTYASDGQPISAPKTVGVLRFAQGRWEFFPLGKAGLPEGVIYNIVCDKTGKIWLDISSSGFCRFDGQTAEAFREGEHGLPRSGHHYALAVGPQGDTWLALGAAGFYHFDGSMWTEFPITRYEFVSTSDSPEAMHVSIDHAGRVWFVIQVESKGSTIFLRYDGNQVEEISQVNIRADVSAFAVDKLGALWVGWLPWYSDDEDILWTYYPDKLEWVQNTVDDTALQGSYIESLCVDKVGRIWAGTADGFTIFEGEESVSWKVIRPGVRHGPILQEDITRDDMYKVNAAYAAGEESPFVWINRYGCVDEEGRVWVQAGHNGIAMFLED
jgi:streptogramin lyase